MIDSGPDPVLVADVLLAHPDVAALHGGAFGEVASYLPGRRVTGVRVSEDSIEVHVVGYLGLPIPALAAAVRSALNPLADGRRIDVVVADVVSPA